MTLKRLSPKAKRIIKLYNDAGIASDRILISWRPRRGIRAAEQLEKKASTS